MNFIKCAIVSFGVALAATTALAGSPDLTAHDLAAQCAARNGTFDASAMECVEPSPDSAASDPIVGPMMQVLGADAEGSANSQ